MRLPVAALATLIAVISTPIMLLAQATSFELSSTKIVRYLATVVAAFGHVSTALNLNSSTYLGSKKLLGVPLT